MNRRVASVILLPALGLALSACGSGRHNQQYLEKSAINGVNASAGGVSIRNAYFTTSAAVGGQATLVFSAYADDPESAATLSSITSTPLTGSTPASLAKVVDGVPHGASEIPVPWQSGPGASIIAAHFDHIQQNALPAAYYPVTFTFSDANGTSSATVKVAVAQVGAVDPSATLLPTSFPEEPFPLVTALPGQSG